MMSGDEPLARQLVSYDKWLSQGDVFLSLPLVSVGLRNDRSLHLMQSDGPAVLITHDCVLDKRNKHGLTIERVHVLPLLTTDGLANARVSNLKAKQGQLQPYEAMYVGALPEVGDCYLLVSNPKVIPAAYFALTATDVGDEDLRATPSAATDSRCGRLHPDDVELLCAKWNAYWTRAVPGD
jgi:hypothetical protein